MTPDRISYDTAPPESGRSIAFRRLKNGVVRTTSTLLLPLIQRVAREHIGGETIDDAMSVACRLADQKRPSTLGFWDTAEYTGRQVADVYLKSIEQMATTGLDNYLSIKPPALRFDPQLATELAGAAHTHGIRLHCDSHGMDAADPSRAMMQSMLGDVPASKLGTTLPGRWSRSLTDADWAIGRGLNIRVVKGQWPDPADPERSMTAGYLEVIDRLAGRARHVAVASHDVPLVAEAIARLRGAGTSCELELIHGVPMAPSLRWAHENRVNVRIYIPYGKGFIPNAIGMLGRDPRLAWRIIKGLVVANPR